MIAHEHNWAFTGRALRPVVDRQFIARRAGAMIVVSEDARRRMIEVERIPPDRLVLLPNGVQALPPGDGRALRSDPGHLPGALQVVGAVHRGAGKALGVGVRAALGGAPVLNCSSPAMAPTAPGWRRF